MICLLPLFPLLLLLPPPPPPPPLPCESHGEEEEDDGEGEGEEEEEKGESKDIVPCTTQSVLLLPEDRLLHKTNVSYIQH